MDKLFVPSKKFSKSRKGSGRTQIIADKAEKLITRSSTVFEFNTGKVVTTTDANNKTTSYFYTDDGGALDSLQRLRRVTLPDGLGETKYEYGDAQGDLYIRTLTKQSATTWLESRTYFDGLGRAWRSGHYEGANSWSVKDTEYDSLGRVKRVTNPYFAANLSGATPGNAAWTTTTYDDLNRALTVTTPDGATVETTFSGNQVTVKDPANKKRSSLTDALGRLAHVVEDPDGVAYQTDYSYDMLGNLTEVNQGGQRRYFFYDSLGRLTRAKNPEQSANSSLNLTNPPAYNNNWSLAYSYDANGNLNQRADARGIVTGYSYDVLNRNTGTNYNINGSQTRSVERVYDGAANGKGRLRYERTKESSVNATQTAIDSYDALGRALRKQQSFWRGSDWGTPYVIQQSYDLAGDVKTVTYPSGRTVNYSYNQAGRLDSFTGNLGDGVNRNYAIGMQYDAAGLMRREQFGTVTPLYHRRHYNNRLQLFDVRLGTDPNPGYDSDDLNSWVGAAGAWNRGALRFYYSTLDGCHVYGNGGTDNNGNLLRMDHQVPLDDAVSDFVASIDRYDYDPLNRVKSVTELSYTKGPSGNDIYQGIFRQAFLYDRWGNRTIDQANTTGAVNKKAYTVDAATNRLTSVDGVAISYDAAGNQINDGSGQRTYDGESRMAEAYNSAGVRVSWYVYDASGRRVVRTVGSQGTWQVYGIGGGLLAEYAVGAAPSVAQKEYGYRNGQLLVVWDGSETGDRQLQWLLQDHLGSTRMVVDRSGSLGGVRRRDFAPFGEELSAGLGIRSASIGYNNDSVREKFTGYEHDDETDLDFAQARYYSAKQGRFTSPDPLHSSAEPGEPQSWNRYVYVGNRPTLIIDPSGLLWYRAKGSGEYGQPVWHDDDPGDGWELISPFGLVYHTADQGWVRLDPNRNRYSTGFASRYDAEQGNALDAFYELIDGLASGAQRLPSNFSSELRGTFRDPGRLLDQAAITLGAVGFTPMKLVSGGVEEGITLYRGVNESHVAFDAALNGVVKPNRRWWQFWKSSSSALDHNAGANGTLTSPFTSWTTDPAVALNYALRPGGGGAVLEAVIPLSRTVASPNLKVISLIQGGGVVSEAEVLVRGVVTGAKVIKAP